MISISKNPVLIILTCCFFIIFLGGCDASLTSTNKILIISIFLAATFFIALVRIDIALGILIFSMLLSPELPIGNLPGREIIFRFDDVLLISIFLGWLAKVAINKELGLLRDTPLNKPIFTYMVVCTVTTLLAVMHGSVNIKNSIFYLLKYFEYFLLFFLVVNNLRDIQQTKIFVKLMFIVATIVSIYAIAQIGTGIRVSAPFEGEGGEANTLGGYLILLMSLALGMLLRSRVFSRKLLLLGLFVLMSIPFLYTLSRGAWLGFIASFIIFIILNKRTRLLLLSLLIIFILFSSFLFPERIRGRVRETFTPYKTYTIFDRSLSLDESTAARVESWKWVLEKFKQKPLLGHGVSATKVFDNQFGRIIVETGLIGLSIFIWLLVIIFNIVRSVYIKQKENSFISGIALGYLCGFFGLLAHSFSASTFIIIRIMEPFWFLTAILVMLQQPFFIKEEQI